MDYKRLARGYNDTRGQPRAAPGRGRAGRRRWILHAAGIACLLASGSLALFTAATPSTTSNQDRTIQPVLHIEPGQHLVLPLELPPPRAVGDPRSYAGDEPGKDPERVVTIHAGDTLSSIFEQMGLSQAELQRMLAAGGAAGGLASIHPGQTLEVYTDRNRELRKLVYHPDETRSVVVRREADGFEARLVADHLERRMAVATGRITDSLFLDGQRAGLADATILQLATIFGWDIDFALDLRAGDRFTVIYEEYYKDGEKVRDGAILAAEFVNRGTTYRAIRYQTEKGRSDYYGPDGRSMRKAFLRTPVKFTRISSRFNLARKHPILHTIRAHTGVDYAAPIGTPVKATGDGKVLYAGRKGGYGNAIILQHGPKYSTLYGHLSRFARGVRTGARVRQGQIIGYVGMSGLATGPHLHYEFRVNGVHHNPLTVPLPKAAPIPARYRNDFREKAHQRFAQLAVVTRAYLAMQED